MKQWEYKKVRMLNLSEDEMNGYGKDGWELVTVYGDGSANRPMAIFKREVAK